MNNADFRSVNLVELEELRDTLLREEKVLDMGYEAFIQTISRLKENGFIQGQLATSLGDVRAKLQRVREEYTGCLGSVYGSINKVKETAVATDSKHNSNLLDIASIDPAKFFDSSSDGSFSHGGGFSASGQDISHGDGFTVDSSDII